MKRLSLFTVLALTLLSALASAAKAPELPDPKKPVIIPTNASDEGGSLGGVELGQKIKKADKAWGGTGDCAKDSVNPQFTHCEYGKDGSSKGLAVISASDGKVTLAYIVAGDKAGDETSNSSFKGSLLEFGTKKGDVGLGDKLSEVAKKYPEAFVTDDSVVFGSDETFPSTSFFARHGQRISSITLGVQGG